MQESITPARVKEHTLNRIGYGQSVWHSARYDALGFLGYVSEQLGGGLAPITIDDVFIQPKIERSVLEQRQLEVVLRDFWFNHFNTNQFGDFPGFRDNFQGRALPEYQNVFIGSHVLGNFEDMLFAVAKSPSMLIYLDNYFNRKPQVFADGTSVGYNENYARELMELHTLGVDGGYDENDVLEVTRILTGWSVQGELGNPPDSFLYQPTWHDEGAKTVMGVDYPAGGGIEEGEDLLRFLAAHPSTGDFLGRKLAIRFIDSVPTQAAVDQAADAYRNSDGDLQSVMQSILLGPYFVPAYERFRTKMKPPHRYVASALMAMGATEAAHWSVLSQELRDQVINAGDTPYFFAPPTGYSEASGFWLSTSSSLLRFQIAALIAYDPTLLALMTARAGVTGDDIEATYTAIAGIMLPGGVSQTTANAVKDHAVAAAMTNEQRISAICHMLMCSPEFLRY